MAGSPIFDKMVQEKGKNPLKGSIYDVKLRPSTPAEKKAGAEAKAKLLATKVPRAPRKATAAKPTPKGKK